jgi:hypothetical protein
MAFVKGHPGFKPKGAVHKSTKIRHSFFEAFETLGGKDSVVKYFEDHPDKIIDFYKMLLSLVPKEDSETPSEFKISLLQVIKNASSGANRAGNTSGEQTVRAECDVLSTESDTVDSSHTGTLTIL